MIRIIAILLLSCNLAVAQITQQTIVNEITANLPTNNQNEISAELLRNTLNQMTSAIFQSQGLSGLTITNTATIGEALIATGTTTASWQSIGGLITSVSNNDGSLNVSPTTGNVVASLNTNHVNNWSVLQTFAPTINVGNGTPLNLGVATVGTSTTQFIPLAVRTIGDPVVAVERTYNNNLGSAAPDSSTFYVGTSVNFGTTANSWGNGILSQVQINSNASSTGQSYMEATRSYCLISAGIATVNQSCWGEVASAASLSPYVALNALEAQTANSSGVDAVGTASWLPSQFKAAGSTIASCFGTNTCDWGYAINAYGATGAQAGFICPKEATPGATVKYGCFVAAGQTPIGLDTTLGTFSSFAIKANGLTIGNTGITLIGGASQLASEQVSIVGDLMVQAAVGSHGVRLNSFANPTDIGSMNFIGRNPSSQFAGFTFDWPISPAVDDSDYLGTPSLRWQSLIVSRKITAANYISAGAVPVGNTGTCTTGVTVAGGSTVGTWTSTNACNIGSTIILTGMPAVTTGYSCDANDRTTSAVVLQQTATSITSATFTVRTTNASANDIIQYKCIGY